MATNDDNEETLRAEQPAAVDLNEEEKEQGSILPILALAAVLALCFRIFVFQPFNIPSGSMFPTLLVGDYLFVSKYSYGYGRYSAPDWLPIHFPRRMAHKDPEVGDVIVFRQPKKNDVDYIKRVVGLPGDTVQVKEGQLYLNGVAVPNIFAGIEEVGGDGLIEVYSKYEETLPNGVKHYIYQKSDYERYDNTELFTVPDNYYFVMGDNRDGSLDSRATEQVGMVPASNLIGKASFLFFSTEGVGNHCPLGEGFMRYPANLFCHLVTWTKVTRYSRIFNSIL